MKNPLSKPKQDVWLRWEDFLGNIGTKVRLVENAPVRFQMEDQLVMTATLKDNVITLYLAAPITTMSSGTLKAWMAELERQKDV